MKLALDVWYELWEKTDSEGDADPDRHLKEGDEPYHEWCEERLERSQGRGGAAR